VALLVYSYVEPFSIERRLETDRHRAIALPNDLRAQQDYESFRQGLKTWLFSRY